MKYLLLLFILVYAIYNFFSFQVYYEMDDFKKLDLKIATELSRQIIVNRFKLSIPYFLVDKDSVSLKGVQIPDVYNHTMVKKINSDTIRLK